jgi:hypothetical protein
MGPRRSTSETAPRASRGARRRFPRGGALCVRPGRDPRPPDQPYPGGPGRRRPGPAREGKALFRDPVGDPPGPLRGRRARPPALARALDGGRAARGRAAGGLPSLANRVSRRGHGLGCLPHAGPRVRVGRARRAGPRRVGFGPGAGRALPVGRTRSARSGGPSAVGDDRSARSPRTPRGRIRGSRGRRPDDRACVPSPLPPRGALGLRAPVRGRAPRADARGSLPFARGRDAMGRRGGGAALRAVERPPDGRSLRDVESRAGPCGRPPDGSQGPGRGLPERLPSVVSRAEASANRCGPLDRSRFRPIRAGRDGAAADGRGETPPRRPEPRAGGRGGRRLPPRALDRRAGRETAGFDLLRPLPKFRRLEQLRRRGA